MLPTRAGVLVAAVFLTGLGCGPGDPCAGSRCPNDSRPTQAQYQDCRNRHNADKGRQCYREAFAWEVCYTSNAVCGSDGKTDSSATLKACEPYSQAVLCCTFGAFGGASCR